MWVPETGLWPSGLTVIAFTHCVILLDPSGLFKLFVVISHCGICLSVLLILRFALFLARSFPDTRNITFNYPLAPVLCVLSFAATGTGRGVWGEGQRAKGEGRGSRVERQGARMAAAVWEGPGYIQSRHPTLVHRCAFQSMLSSQPLPAPGPLLCSLHLLASLHQRCSVPVFITSLFHMCLVQLLWSVEPMAFFKIPF